MQVFMTSFSYQLIRQSNVLTKQILQFILISIIKSSLVRNVFVFLWIVWKLLLLDLQPILNNMEKIIYLFIDFFFLHIGTFLEGASKEIQKFILLYHPTARALQWNCTVPWQLSCFMPLFLLLIFLFVPFVEMIKKNCRLM